MVLMIYWYTMCKKMKESECSHEQKTATKPTCQIEVSISHVEWMACKMWKEWKLRLLLFIKNEQWNWMPLWQRKRIGLIPVFTLCYWEKGNLVDSASSHTLVSKIKPCMSKYKYITVKLRMAHYISYSFFDSPLLLG